MGTYEVLERKTVTERHIVMAESFADAKKLFLDGSASNEGNSTDEVHAVTIVNLDGVGRSIDDIEDEGPSLQEDVAALRAIASAQKVEITFLDQFVIDPSPVKHPVVDEGDLVKLIGSLVTDWPQFDTDEPVNGGDAVEWLETKREEARQLLKDIGWPVPEKPIKVDQPPMAFEYYEVLPCLENYEGEVESFRSDEDRDAAVKSYGREIPRQFYTLYGRFPDADGALLAMAVADFTLKADAMQVMNAILAPMAKASNELREVYDNAKLVHIPDGIQNDIGEIADSLDDVINQSSNGERA